MRNMTTWNGGYRKSPSKNVFILLDRIINFRTRTRSDLGHETKRFLADGRLDTNPLQRITTDGTPGAHNNKRALTLDAHLLFVGHY